MQSRPENANRIERWTANRPGSQRIICRANGGLSLATSLFRRAADGDRPRSALMRPHLAKEIHSPDGTGGSPVLPKNDFTNTRSDANRKSLFRIEVQVFDRFGHGFARDMSCLCQRIERRDGGALGIHFEEPA